MTEGGISPLEKAIEWGEEFAAALIAKASQVEANGIIVEDAAPEDLYGDEKVKWGDQVIYVDKRKADAFAKTEETLSKAPPPQEEEERGSGEMLAHILEHPDTSNTDIQVFVQFLPRFDKLICRNRGWLLAQRRNPKDSLHGFLPSRNILLLAVRLLIRARRGNQETVLFQK